MAANAAFNLVNEHGWRRGFHNLLSNETNAWWHTRTWLVQCLIWIAILNGLLIAVLRPIPEDVARLQEQQQAGQVSAYSKATQTQAMQGLMVFFLLAGVTVPIAAIALGQDSIIGEKQSGTAAWILSKPASRPAFILSKLFAHALGFLITAITVPGIIAYLQISIAGETSLTLLGFTAGMGLVYLNLLFYLTLTIMLGTIFSGRGPVLGIAFAISFSWQFIIGTLPWLAKVMPWTMVVNTSQDQLPLAFSLAIGQPLPTVTPIIATVLWCLLFTALAIYRFQREEF